MKKFIKAAFLDRDGVINEDLGYVYKKEDFIFKNGIIKLLKTLQKLNFNIFIITNQSGIARGYYQKNDFHKLMKWMLKKLEDENIKIIDYLYCPHHPSITGECECRKPKPGMIMELAKKYNIKLSNSILIGDKDTDIQACKKAKLKKCYKVGKNLEEVIVKIQKDFGEI